MEIDAGRQQAAVANLESRARRARGGRAVRAAAGRAHEEAATTPARSASRSTSRRRPRCRPRRRNCERVDAQIREQRGRARLPPRDRADRRASSATFPCASAIASRESTMLTTIDENAGLELYINVPVAAGAGTRSRPAGAHRRRSRPSRLRPTRDQLRVAVGRHRNAVGAGQGAARAATRRSAPSSSCARSVVWSDDARA